MSNEYKRLTDVLAHCWDRPWASLSTVQRDAWLLAFGCRYPVENVPTEIGESITQDGIWPVYQRWSPPIWRWDSLHFSNRMRLANQFDLQHDPENQVARQREWDYWMAIDEKEREIAKAEKQNHQGIPSEAKTKADVLSQLKIELELLKAATPDTENVGADSPAVKVSHGDTAPDEEPKTKNWILLVQAEATRRWKSLREEGANPTKHNIKDDLATWCRETNVRTDGDINPSGDYIYRHVLRKWTPPKG